MISQKRTGDEASSAGEEAYEAATPNPFEPLRKHLGELGEYLSHYLTARADQIKLRARSAAILGGLAVLAAVAALAIAATAAVLALLGIAHGLALLFGGHLWAGELVTGFGVLLLGGAATYAAVAKVNQSSRKKTQEKYEHRRQNQRIAFGHDAAERAAQRHEAH